MGGGGLPSILLQKGVAGGGGGGGNQHDYILAAHNHPHSFRIHVGFVLFWFGFAFFVLCDFHVPARKLSNIVST